MSSTPATPDVQELSAGPLRLAVRPDLGASIAGFWHGDVPLLRSTAPAALQAARQAGCYPLVPYSNRIADRHFRWNGRDETTAPNFDDSPHSLHGVGWRRAWRVETRGDAELTLAYDHAPDADWPYPFSVRQSFCLTPAALTVVLLLTNTADVVQPTGLGWHPYFPKRDRSAVRMAVTARWDPDTAELPVRRVSLTGIDAPVASLALDHCFSGWDGEALLTDAHATLHLTSNLDHLVVYTPATKPYFCVEPVSHLSNAINFPDPLAHGLRALAPGQTQRAEMSLTVGRRGGAT